MIVEKTLAALAAAVAIAAAAAVSVVAAAFALYAVLLPHFGAAGAAASLAVVFAIVALVGGLVAARVAEGPRRHSHQQEPPPVTESLLAKAFELAKEKPLIAAGAAVAAGIFVIRNPAVLSALVSAFLSGSNPPPPPKR